MKVWWKSFFLIALLNVLLISFVWEQAGRAGLAWGFLLALSINYYLVLYSPLRRLCPKGYQTLEGEDPWGLLEEVRQFAKRAKIPTPKVCIWQSDQMQGFVFGRIPYKGHLGFSTATLKNLNPEELQVLIGWSSLALKSGRVVNWTFLGLFLNLIFIFLSSVDRILSGLVTRRINRPHGATLWIAGPLIFVIQRLFCRKEEYLKLDKELEKFGISSELTAQVIKKIYFQNQTHFPEGDLAFAHLYFSSPLLKLGLLPLLRLQPSFKSRILKLRGNYPV